MNKKVLTIVAVFVLVVVGIIFFVTSQGKDDAAPVAVYLEYSPGEYFVTNVNESNRLFKVSLVLMVNDETLMETLETNNSLIRDKIIFILRSLTEDDLRSNDNVINLRQQILDELNKSLGTSGIIEVRFNDFVMQ